MLQWGSTFESESSSGAAPSSPLLPAPFAAFPLVCRSVTRLGEVLMSSAKLYVGNLSYDTSEASLRTLFAPHGEVISVNLITDRDSRRSKGLAFVEMSTPEASW